jgi:hypothetical protein
MAKTPSSESTQTWQDPEDLADDLQDMEMDPDFDEREGAAGWGISDLVRRAILSGVGAAMDTQDGVRGAVRDLKLPKDAVGYLIGQADRTKQELTRAMARELRGFLDGLELHEILVKVLSNVKIQMHLQVRVVPSKEGGFSLSMDDLDLGELDEDSPIRKDMEAEAAAAEEEKTSRAKKKPAKRKARSRKKKAAD